MAYVRVARVVGVGCDHRRQPQILGVDRVAQQILDVDRVAATVDRQGLTVVGEGHVADRHLGRLDHDRHGVDHRIYAGRLCLHL